jgi:hypothetical protein
MTITDDADAGYVSDRRQEVKERLKEIEKFRKHITEPLLESKKRIDLEAKRISTPLEAIVQVLDSKLIGWHKAQEQVRIEAEKKKRAEEAKRLEEEKKAQLKVAMLTNDEKAASNVSEIDKNLERLEARPIQIQNNVRTARSTSYLIERWTYEVVDPLQIPREFLMVDESKLRKFATETQGEKQVPGVKFFKEASIGGRK